MDATNYELTKRETDVLVLVAKKLMSKEIADPGAALRGAAPGPRRERDVLSSKGLPMFIRRNPFPQ